MRCSVPGCESDSRYSPKSLDITFFKLPSEPSLRTAWLQVLGIKEPWKPEKKVSVCSDHFLCEDLFVKSGLLTVREDAVPFIIQDSSYNKCENGSSLMVCRICLVMDVKLISMSEYKLEQAYEQLTGVSPFAKNRLPSELCAECAQRLINFSRFRHKSLRANSLMVELLKKHNELTKSEIQLVNRENNQLISNLTTETIIDHYDLYIEEVDDEEVEIAPEEVNPVDTPDLDTTMNTEDEEINDDILTSNYDESNVKDDDYSTDNSSNLEETKKKGVKYILYEKIDEDEEVINNDMVLNKDDESDAIDDVYSSDNSLPLEETKKKNEEYIPYEMVEENSEDEEVINNNMMSNKYDESDVRYDDYSSDNSLPLEEYKNKSEEYMLNDKVKTEKHGEKVDGQKKTLVNDYLKTFTVTYLTLKEQLADIENRKESLNYKNSPFKCIKCYKGFLNADTYNTHMIRHTTVYGEYSCSICKLHYKRKHICTNHQMSNHVKKFRCTQCPFVTTNRQSAKRHSEWHKGTKYKCPHCDEVFDKHSSYMSHVRIKHPSDFVCVLCGYSFVSEKGITVHKYLKHRLNNQPIPEDGPVCETCDLRFLDIEALKRHLSVSKRHESVDDKQRNDAASQRTDKTRLWEKKRRELNSKAEGPITCEQCGVQSKDSRAYNAHFKLMHPEKNRTKYPSIKSPFMCEVCGKIVSCYAKLESHNRAHKGERPFKCDQCDKSFLEKHRLAAHKQTHIAEKTMYKCELCGKQFKWQGNRKRHMLIHAGLKPYKCEFCGKGFKLPSETRNHIKYMHHKIPWPKRIRGKRRTDGRKVKLSNQQPASPASDEDTNHMEL